MANFVSFAQNAEDVMLWRALQDVGHGFYIDIGAGDPERDSVTAAFYSRGWRGLNVEPNATLHAKLCQRRPDDINLHLAAGAEAGEVELFLVEDDDRLSTTRPEIAGRHDAAGHGMRRDVIAMRPLRDLCAEHARDPIHFLKIDVEGAEAEVLRGADFTRWRPWLILIEAIDPTSLQPNHEAWEGMLLQAGYHSVYFDGLNRFYVADEQATRLDHHFTMPPNVRDAFVRNTEAVTMDLQRIEAEHATVVAGLHHEAHRLRAELEACIRSRDDMAASQQAAEAGTRVEMDRRDTDHAAVVAELHHETYRLRAELEACIVSREEIAASAAAAQAEISQLREQLQARTAERDGWMQELFETNRHAADLTRQRQDLVERLGALAPHASNMEQELARTQAELERLNGMRPEAPPPDVALLPHHMAELAEARQALQATQQHVAAIRSSTSWRLTLPLRVLRRAVTGRRQG